MNRCQLLRALLALAASATVFTSFAQEAVRRDAPRDVKLGMMTVVAPPVIGLDGREDRLSPGSRIRDTRNMVVLSGTLAGKTVPIVYKRDAAGLVHEAWMLTADEYKQLSGVAPSEFGPRLVVIFGSRP